MQESGSNIRAYQLRHQRISLEVDFSIKSIFGYVELIIEPLIPDLKKIRLNCRQLTIRKILINKIQAQYNLSDPIKNVLPTNKNVNYHNEFKQEFFNSLQEADEGELVINIPEEIEIKKIITNNNNNSNINTNTTTTTTSNNKESTTENDKEANGNAPSVEQERYYPIIVRIEYELVDPSSGVYFNMPDPEAAPYRYPHMYTYNQCGFARLWLPCIDKYQERCTWEMEYIVAKTVRPQMLDNDSYIDDDEDDEAELTVVSSGELVEQIIHPLDSSKKIFYYTLNVPSAAPNIYFTVGPYKMRKLIGWQSMGKSANSTASNANNAVNNSNKNSLNKNKNADSNIKNSKEKSSIENIEKEENDENEILSNNISGIGGGYIFYLPGRKEEAEYTTNFIQQAFSFYVQYIGTPYPYLSFKLVCLENPINPLIVGTTIGFMSTLYLVTNDIIDQVYETRKNISRSLIMQWFGSYIVQKTWADTWLIHGISHYIAGLFLKRHFGNNEYRYRLRKDIDYLVKLDVNQPPLHPIMVASEDNQTFIPDPLILLHYSPEDDYLSSRSEFISLKSPLVLYMLNKRLGKGILQKVITRIINTFDQGEIPFGLSTHHFLKLCRKLSKDIDLKEFADQWIYGTGIPKFYFTHHFNRKRMTVEFKFRQESTSNWGKKIKFTGPLTIRVHEPSGVFDTEVQVSEIQQNFDVQYHTKYKRIRSTKSKKKRKSKKNMEEDELEDDEETDENEEVNWGEGTDRSPVEWIRMDPDTEWLTLIILEQTHFMWGNQLQKDKDVIAQHHAISELKYHNIPEEAVSAVVLTLEKAMLDCSNYYKIRMEASKTIVYCSAVQGIEKLMKAYKEQFCYPYHESTNAYIPYSNDFSNLSEYFVQKSIPAGMIGARDEHDLAFYDVRKFILDLLKNNDNTDNQYSDCYLIASLITSIGLAFVPTKKTTTKPKITIETNEVKNQIDEEGDLVVEEFEFDGSDNENQDIVQKNKLQNISEVEAQKENSIFKEALEEIERYRIRDMIMPSYHNIVTVKCLETYHLWMMAELIPVNYKIFLPYTRYGTCLFIRLVAIDAIIILNGLFIDSICKYIFYLLRDDPSPYFRFHIVKSLVAYISLLGGITDSDVEKKSQIIENSTNMINQKSKFNQNELLKKYRNEFAENKFVREMIWDLLNNNPVQDHRIRMKLLYLCEILYIPIIPETPPVSQKGSLMKLKIRMSSTILDKDKEKDNVEPIKKPKIPITINSNMIRERDKEKEKEREREKEKERGREKDRERGRIRDRERSRDRERVWERDRSRSKDRIRERSRDRERSREREKIIIELKDENKRPSILKVKELKEDSKRPSIIKVKEPKKESKEDVKRPSIIKVKEQTKEEKPSKYERNSKSESRLKSIVFNYEKEEKTEKKEKKNADNNKQERVEKSDAKENISKFMTLGTILINSLRNNNNSPPFLLPVENIPFYHDIIKYPMDISTAEKKLKSGQYNNKFEELIRDIRQIFQNCYIFNQDDSDISKQCKNLEIVFEEGIIPKIQREAKKMNYILPNNINDIEPLYKRQDLNQNNTVASTPAVKDSIKINISSNKSTSLKLERKHSSRVKSQSVASNINNVSASSPEHNNNNNSKISEKTSSIVIPTPSQNREKITNEMIPPKPINNYKNEMKMCKKTIGKLLRHYDSGYFRDPVDPVLFNIPTYFTIVKHPMDFGTIKKKLENKEYKDKNEFECDVRLVFSNCFLFNPPGTPVNDAGKMVENFFNKEWVEMNGEIMVGKDELKLCNKIIMKLQKHKSATQFLLPVDRNLYPQYYELIRKPMDLSTLKARLNKGKYDKLSKFENDVRLIFRNCYTFNDSSSFLSQQAHILESYFNKEWLADLTKLKEKQYMRANSIISTTENSVEEVPMDSVKIKSSVKKSKANESMNTENTIKIRTSMSPEPSEHSKTIIFLKNNNNNGNAKNEESKEYQENNNIINISKSKKNSLYNAEKESVKRIKKDNGIDNMKESKNTTTADASGSGNIETKEQNSFTPNSREYHKCQVITRKMQKHKYGGPFLEPVDPVALNIPTYFTIIKHPMDLSTIENNLNKKKYTNIISYYKDVDLMFKNCFKFNLPEEYVYQAGKSLQAFFEKEWTNAGLPTIKITDKKSKHLSRESLIGEMDDKKKEEHKIASRERERDNDNSILSNKSLEKENNNLRENSNKNVEIEEPLKTSIPNKKHKHDNKIPSSIESPTPKALSSSIKNQLINIVQKLQNHSCSQIFLEPVDPQQFPDYHKFIHNPMDLSTIKKKLEKNKYQTIEDFSSDVSLIFSNCNIYNPPGSWAREQGQKLEEYWLGLSKSLNQYKEKSNHEGRSMPIVEVKVCESIIRKMLRNPNSTAFKDPVPTTIPMYHDIIKKPMDFSTLKTNLDNKKYATLEEFHSDLILIFKNCYTFNMEGSELFVAAQNLEQAFKELWNRRHDLIRQANEKLAQKGYNVKHLKHRSSSILVQNSVNESGTNGNTIHGSKSKTSIQGDDESINYISKQQKNNMNNNNTLPSAKVKQYPSFKKDRIASYQNSKLKNEDDYNYNKSEGYKEKDRKHLKKHGLEENTYDEDNDSSYKEYKSKKKRIRYDDDNGDDDNDDMDIEYYNNNINKKSHDTNRSSSIHGHRSHGHHRHSSSHYAQDDPHGHAHSPRPSSSKRVNSRLKESRMNDDDDEDDNNSSYDNQGNLKIKIKI